MTGTTPEAPTVRELPLEPGGEVELQLTASSVLLRGVERDVVTVRSLDGEDVEDQFTIEQLPGKVSVRDNATGFRLGSVGPRPSQPADLEIEVPRSAAIALRTVSGDVEATGVAGASRWATASGDVRLQVDGGPVTVESMSGDVDVVASEPIELRARSVSGDLTLHGRRFDVLAASTTSGDLRVDAELGEGADHAISSVSGDVELTTPSAVRVDTQSIAGDVRASGTHRTEGGRGRRVLIVGAGTVGVSIRTTSGDIRLRGGQAVDVPAPPAPVPPGVPAAPVPPVAPTPPIVVVAEAEAAPNLVRPSADGGGGAIDRREAARLEILRALERGDLDIESASHRLEILEDAGPRYFRGWC